MDTTIRQLLASDVPALAAFAESCFREAFGEQLGPEALERICAVAFTQAVLERLVLDGVWLAGDWQGYIALGAVPCPVPELAGPTLELARLYVPQGWQGQGIANRLLERFLIEARQRGARSLWLQAYEGSSRALAFYRRWGFTDFGPYPLVCEGIVLPHRALGRNL
jgi:GNAT superfamily N-acetyltransferase